MFRSALQSVYGGEIAYRPPAPFQHRFHYPLSEEKLAAQVDVNQPIELFEGNFEKGAIESYARVIHQAVDAAQKFDSLIRQGEHLFDALEIRLVSHGAPSHGPYFFSRRERSRVHGVMQHDVSALPGEFESNLTSDTGPGAGYERPFSC